MGQIANQMVLDAFFKLKEKIKEQRKEKKRNKQQTSDENK